MREYDAVSGRGQGLMEEAANPFTIDLLYAGIHFSKPSRTNRVTGAVSIATGGTLRCGPMVA